MSKYNCIIRRCSQHSSWHRFGLGLRIGLAFCTVV